MTSKHTASHFINLPSLSDFITGVGLWGSNSRLTSVISLPKLFSISTIFRIYSTKFEIQSHRSIRHITLTYLFFNSTLCLLSSPPTTHLSTATANGALTYPSNRFSTLTVLVPSLGSEGLSECKQVDVNLHMQWYPTPTCDNLHQASELPAKQHSGLLKMESNEHSSCGNHVYCQNI